MKRSEEAPQKIHPPLVAGIFYPEEAQEILAVFAQHGLDAGDEGRAQVLIAPHAGWQYSASTIAKGFANLQTKNIQTVIILGVPHEPLEHGVYLDDADFVETPLGPIPMDTEKTALLESCSTGFNLNGIPHLKDHSTEVLLPFVKHRYPEASLVSVLISGYKQSDITALSRGLDLLWQEEPESTIILVSANCAAHKNSNTADQQAELFIRLLREKNAEALLAATKEHNISSCAASACAALLSTTLLSDREARICSHAVSGKEGLRVDEEDSDKQVHYLSLVYTRATDTP